MGKMKLTKCKKVIYIRYTYMSVLVLSGITTGEIMTLNYNYLSEIIISYSVQIFVIVTVFLITN